MKIQEKQTTVSKSFHGWQANTIRTEKGQTFEICTMKRYSGKVTTSVTKVDVSTSNGFMVTSFGMNDGFMNIDHGKITATEKAIKDNHFKALAMFDLAIEKIPEEMIRAVETPEIGDILFLDGYGKTKNSPENFWIVYKITKDDYGTKYHCVEKDTLKLQVKDFVKPWAKKFGIGIYYEKGFNIEKFGIDENKLSDMLIDAQTVKKEAAEAQRIAAEKATKAAEEKRIYLSQFTPADRRKTTNIIKSYCLKNFKISKIEVSTDVFSGGDSMDVVYYSPEKIEDLEKFINQFKAGYFDGMNDIYEYHHDRPEIIIEGHILQDYKYVGVKHVETEPIQPEPQPETPAPPVNETPAPGKIQIIDYSEKSFAVIGETRPIKDLLKSLGGRFNFNLTCGPGWIFSMKMKDEVSKHVL